MPDPEVAPPIDGAMQQAVSNAIVQSGASGLGPSTAPTPLGVASHGGDDPSVTFNFLRGSDGKLYGKGGTPPPGPRNSVTIRIREFRGRWLVASEITHVVSFTTGTTVETGRMTDGIGISGATSNYEIHDDQGIGWNIPGVRSSEVRNAERFEKFLPNDLLTAVRQSLWSLQAKGRLYQFVVTPSPDDFPSQNTLLAAAMLLVATGVFAFVAGLGSGAVEAPPPATPSPAAPASAGVGPVVGPIVATFAGTTTTYRVQASAPAGVTLAYRWTNTNPCGTQTGQTTATFAWDHPDVPGGCPVEAVHPGLVTVAVTAAGAPEITRGYVAGSASGTGAALALATPAGAGPVATATQVRATTAPGADLSLGSPRPTSPALAAAGVGLALGGAALAAHTLRRRGRRAGGRAVA